MQVNKVNNSPNFGAIYRVPYSQKTLMEIKNKVIPPYHIVRHRKAIEIPEMWQDYLTRTLAEVAQKEGASADWLYVNAKNHGLILPKVEDSKVFVFSGDKDILEFKDFIEKNTGKIALFKLKLKQTFNPEIVQIPVDTPKHLLPLYGCKEVINKLKNIYEEFFSTRKVIDVSTSQDLLAKMLQEV